MELRHLRCFLAVAEELHFARAAEKLHIEQSPLSRAIKELEEELGVVLFARTTPSTRFTRAGKLFLEHVPRVFAALQQARDSVKAAANGFHCQLRIALSDGITPSRLPNLLALCRREEPEVEMRFFEVLLSQQIKGLHDDLYDIGFAQSDEVGDGIVAIPVWSDPLMVAVPARHPLLKHKRIPLEELLRYPLALCDPQACEGHARHGGHAFRGDFWHVRVAVDHRRRRVDAGVGSGDQYNSAAYYRQSVQQAAAQTSQQVLAPYINIPPTVTVPAGSRVRIYVNKDLDFTPIYKAEIDASKRDGVTFIQ